MRKRLLALCVTISLLVLFATSCRCGGEGSLAVLKDESGTVDRDRAAAVGQWTDAEVGAKFDVGDGLRTGTASSARVDLEDRSQIRLEEETIIRFRDRAPGGEQGLELELGNALVEAGEKPLHLRTEVGLARIDPRGKLKLSRTERGYRFEVSVGKAQLEQANGETATLERGVPLDVGIGEAVVEPARVDAGRKEKQPEAGPPQLAFDSGELVVDIQTAGARVRSPGSDKSTSAPRGEMKLEGGAVLQLSAGGRAELTRGAETVTLRGAGEFVMGKPGQPIVTTRAGRVTASKGAVAVAVPGGAIIVRPDSAADLTVSGKRGAEVEVTQGLVSIHAKQRRETLRAGERGVLSQNGSVEVEGRSLGYFDLLLGAGESAVVHDPEPPTAVGLAPGKTCPEEALVDWSASGKRGEVSARGKGPVSAELAAGRYEYGVRCITNGTVSETVAAKGHVTVLHDLGTRPLPRSAPHSHIETDGRQYTILYQNLLPRVSVSWPRAPKSPSYTLSVSGPGGTRTFSSTSPRYTFSSGSLLEGTHRLTFANAGGGRSRTTTVRVAFDNAAPAASLEAPANRSFSPGANVTVAGVTLPGWTVAVGGKTLPTDAQRRFSGTATTPTEQRALAVRFGQRGRGVHYYLRHAR